MHAAHCCKLEMGVMEFTGSLETVCVFLLDKLWHV